MKFEMLAVYDSKARIFLAPWVALNLQVAVRQFSEVASTPGSMPCKHPEDFSLFHIGRFDDDTSLVEPLNPPINLGMAAAFKETNV